MCLRGSFLGRRNSSCDQAAMRKAAPTIGMGLKRDCWNNSPRWGARSVPRNIHGHSGPTFRFRQNSDWNSAKATMTGTVKLSGKAMETRKARKSAKPKENTTGKVIAKLTETTKMAPKTRGRLPARKAPASKHPRLAKARISRLPCFRLCRKRLRDQLGCREQSIPSPEPIRERVSVS